MLTPHFTCEEKNTISPPHVNLQCGVFLHVKRQTTFSHVTDFHMWTCNSTCESEIFTRNFSHVKRTNFTRASESHMQIHVFLLTRKGGVNVWTLNLKCENAISSVFFFVREHSFLHCVHVYTCNVESSEALTSHYYYRFSQGVDTWKGHKVMFTLKSSNVLQFYTLK